MNMILQLNRESVTLLLAVLTTCLVNNVYSQVYVPTRSLGFVYNDRCCQYGVDVSLDFYVDLLCWDSKLVWYRVKALTNSFLTDQLRLTVHLFPLPYHRNAFLAAQGAHAVFHLTKNVTKTFLYMDAVFDNQSELSEDMTAAETVMLIPKKLMPSYTGMEECEKTNTTTKRKMLR